MPLEISTPPDWVHNAEDDDPAQLLNTSSPSPHRLPRGLYDADDNYQSYLVDTDGNGIDGNGLPEASLAAADSLALPRCASYENDSVRVVYPASSDFLALPQEYNIHRNESFADTSLAAADSLALPTEDELYPEHGLPSDSTVKTRRRRRITFLCIASFLLVGIIVLSVIFTNTKEDAEQIVNKNEEITGQNFDSIEEIAHENVEGDNIFLSDPEEYAIYNLLRLKVHDSSALMNMNKPEGKAFNTLVKETKLNQAPLRRSTDVYYIQRYALLVFYYGTDGGAWTRNIGWTDPWLTFPEGCEHSHGIDCQDSSVTKIYLDRNNLHGMIPEDFCLLHGLESLRLSDNEVKLPSCFSKLSKLEELKLKGNNYSGELPSNLYSMTSLTSLTLSDNKFEGTINALFPKAKSNERYFPSLIVLNLANNNLSGVIPESTLRRLPTLDTLILNGNTGLSGSLNEMCKGDRIGEIEADCDMVACKCCTSGTNCHASSLPV